LWTWGSNSYGRLGANNLIFRSSPVQIGSGTSWNLFSAGENVSFAISATKALYAWGRNQYGLNAQNDSGDATSRSSPTQVGALTDWQYVAGGEYHVLAIKTNNTLWMWGRESTSGCLGQNTYSTSRSSPIQVGALTNWATGAVGTQFTVAVKTNGTLWSWGRNDYGMLGQNNTTSRSSPVQVGSLTNWSAVSARKAHTVAIKTDGTLWSWGNGGNGKLGDGQAYNRSSPVQIGALTSWATAAASNGFSLANLGVV
jgi:alpha-tubulin suppressor-like RCC1 family protein